MARGRPPKPIAQHKADGTFRKDRHAPRVVAFPGTDKEVAKPVSLPVPKGLTKEAKDWWNENVPQMAAIGLLEHIDVSMLTIIARTYQRWCEVDKLMSKHPMLREQYLKEESELRTAYHRMTADFGFTPGSRARLKVQPSSDQKRGVARRDRGTG